MGLEPSGPCQRWGPAPPGVIPWASRSQGGNRCAPCVKLHLSPTRRGCWYRSSETFSVHPAAMLGLATARWEGAASPSESQPGRLLAVLSNHSRGLLSAHYWKSSHVWRHGIFPATLQGQDSVLMAAGTGGHRVLLGAPHSPPGQSGLWTE